MILVTVANKIFLFLTPMRISPHPLRHIVSLQRVQLMRFSNKKKVRPEGRTQLEKSCVWMAGRSPSGTS